MILEPIIGCHYWLNGTELKVAREKLGLSEEEFGSRCGWSQPFQCILEHPEPQEKRKIVNAEMAEKIKSVLERNVKWKK